MKANEGKVDRIIRAIGGVCLFVIGFFIVKGTLGLIMGIISLGLLITAALGYCALYPLLKIDTTRKAPEPQ